MPSHSRNLTCHFETANSPRCSACSRGWCGAKSVAVFGGPGDHELRILSDAFGGNCKTALQLSCSCSFIAMDFLGIVCTVRTVLLYYRIIVLYCIVLCHISPVCPPHTTITQKKQPTVGGTQQNGMPLRLVCISPSMSSASETISSLEFATRAMDVEVHVPQLRIRSD